MRSSLPKLLRLRPCLSHSTTASNCRYAALASCTTLASTETSASDSNSSYRAHWALATAALAGAWALTAGTAPAAAASDAALPRDADGHIEPDGVTSEGKLLSLSLRQRIFFKYEKRIRELSSLEKVFEYFSTHDRNGAKYMNGKDVVRSLVPTYPPYGSSMERGGLLDGERGQTVEAQDTERSIFNKIDTDGDGLISFSEYVVVVLLLSIPEGEIHTVFDIMDLDDNGTLQLDEFLQVVNALEKRAGIQSNFVGRTGSQRKNMNGDLGGLVANFFGVDGRKQLDLRAFRDFLHQLYDDIVRLEFAHYDYKHSGTILAVDFANSIAAAAEIRHVDKVLDKVSDMPESLKQRPITLKQFRELATLRRKLPQLAFALEFCNQVGVSVKKSDFNKLLKKTLAFQLSPAVLDVIFYLFGNEEGHLNGEGLVDALSRRDRLPGKRLLTPGGSTGVGAEGNVFNLYWGCFKHCISSESI